jgi:anti-sigma-K factor RskA
MDYGRPQLADRLAAEYVLGTLRGPARRRFQALLPAHPALRDAVRGWEERLVLLASSEEGVAPPERVWQGVTKRLFSASTGAAAEPTAQSAAARAYDGWRSMAWWRTLAGAGFVASLALVVVLNQTPPPQAPVVVLLQANPEVAQAAQAVFGTQAAFVASVSADGRALVLKPLATLPAPAQKALELWAVPTSGAPRSLGLVQANGATTVQRAALLQGTAAFAVSVEPEGGSPTGAPTGPIVSLGRI